MAEDFFVSEELSLEEKYSFLISQLENLLLPEDNLLSSLSNFTAAVKQTFSKISWIGFYIFDGDHLYLGPFQGKVACTKIEIGKGVCGTAARRKETIVVEDVNKFPGHIACDADSKSEIVVPIFKDDKLWGVLDLDSADYNSFSETDKKYLEQIVNFLTTKILK